MARRKSDATDTAFRYIRNQITKYELKPGDVVSDSAISQELSISRTPVREAMTQLVNTGLIEKSGYRFLVTHITYPLITDVFELREAIESYSVRKIIENGGLNAFQRKELEKIQNSFREAINSHNIQSTFKPDSDFHMKLVEIAGNKLAFETTKDLEFMSERIRWLSMLTPTRYENTFTEHENILKSLVSMNEKAAVKHTESHIRNSLKNYEKVMEIANWEDIIISIHNTIMASHKDTEEN